ncbi:biotin--[acetyl-CoA-carboxylase] ligase [Spirochaetia bacterium]|nr:biotin--[acetyl-CoA-carboxylase] ligase [Spirochaetia bacterium]
MTELTITNPFGAPVYYKESVASTMEEARALAARGAPCGTVIAAGFQTAGRGRQGRQWAADAGRNLFFTILLDAEGLKPILQVITLRTGLALALAIEDFAPDLRRSVEIKWPNDCMIAGKKTAGILCESDGAHVYIGIGVNIFQKDFSAALAHKATSIALALESLPQNECCPFPTAIPAKAEPVLLEHILKRLFNELHDTDFREAILERLFMRRQTVRFIPGPAGAGTQALEGTLEGIGKHGELLIKDSSGTLLSFTTGELDVYAQL